MFGQAVADSPGFGAAEIIAIISGVSLVIGAITTLIVQIVKLRKENTDQHAESRQIVTDVRDRLLDIHSSVSRVDSKVENVADRLDRHEQLHHRGRRRW